jgi:DNA-binding MarR family transcriptional regulator
VRHALESQLLRDVTRLPLSAAQFRLLETMARDGEHHIGDVASLLGISSPAATKVIDKLEALGLVERVPAPHDRRVRSLVISARARRIVARWDRLQAARWGSVVEDLGPEESERLAAALEALTLRMLEEKPPGIDVCLRCRTYLGERCPRRASGQVCPFVKRTRRRREPLRRAEG